MIPLSELALQLGATLHRIAGDSASRSAEMDPAITGVSSLGQATSHTLVFAEDAASLAAAIVSGAGGVLVSPALGEQWTGTEKPVAQTPLLLVAQPRLAFARAAKLLAAAADSTTDSNLAGSGIHPTAVIAPGASVAANVSVGAHAVIEDQARVGASSSIGSGVVIGRGVSVGADCRVYPRVVLYPGTVLGDRVVVHAGCVLGGDGFGYVRDAETGEYLQFPQQGRLVIEDDVEIGANTTVDRGALEETRIARGAKIDNLVHIGHNVRIGKNAVIAAQTGISGSTTIGDNAILGGQVGIGDHADVGEGVILGGQAGILPWKKVRGKGVFFWGTPAQPVKRYLRQLAAVARLSRSSKDLAESPKRDPEQRED